MKSASKWLLAGGAILLMFGFFLPIAFISHQSMEKISISLLRVAGLSYWFFLYLIPIVALAMLLLAIIPIEDQKLKMVFLVGEVAGWILIFLLVLVTFAYFLITHEQLLNLGSFPIGSQIANFDIWPSIGLLVLLPGIGIIFLGILAQFLPEKEQVNQSKPEPEHSSNDQKPEVIKGVHLEAIKGNRVGEKISVDEDDFSIGRGRDNSLQLLNTRVSRLHARLRYSQGSWFIQDQNSKIGILVNGKSIKAGRLVTGDHIQIGEDIFIFHA